MNRPRPILVVEPRAFLFRAGCLEPFPNVYVNRETAIEAFHCPAAQEAKVQIVGASAHSTLAPGEVYAIHNAAIFLH